MYTNTVQGVDSNTHVHIYADDNIMLIVVCGYTTITITICMYINYNDYYYAYGKG